MRLEERRLTAIDEGDLAARVQWWQARIS